MPKENTFEEYRALIDWYERIYTMRFCDLACGLIEYDGKPDGVSNGFITRLLIENGRAWLLRNHGAADGMYTGAPERFTRYMRPQRATLNAANGVYIGTFEAFDNEGKALDAVELRANEYAEPLINDIKKTARMMAEIDAAIMSNVYNASASDILAVKTEAQRDQLLDALRKRNVGSPAVAVIKPRKKGDDISGGDLDDAVQTVLRGNSSPFIADKLFDLQGAFETEQLKRLGVLSPNDYKRERTQTAEVNAGASAVLDWAYIMIDTFNEDAKAAGVGLVARFNGAVNEFINEGSPEPVETEPAPEETEKKENA